MVVSFSPQETVSELDRHIIGQNDAKRAVAIALRTRWRRSKLEPELQEEVYPKNILMIGPTGVGKTEIARRLAKLANAPFLKVEATKFTEVGYVGKDVESIIRDLTDMAIHMTQESLRKTVRTQAEIYAEERVLDVLVGDTAGEGTRTNFRKKLRDGELNEHEIEVDVLDNSNPMGNMLDVPGIPGASMGMVNIGDVFGKAFGERRKKKRMSVLQSYDVLLAEESDKLLDEDKIVADALELVQQNGIVFIDEIDKITTRQDVRGGDVSREGVQRDLLPLIEGTTVTTRHGTVKTDHMLFIASGAFHYSKPSDLLAELQGRLPIRVELRALTVEDFKRILKETEANLVMQYEALIGTEGVTLKFEEEAIDEIARLSFEVNEQVENIGARRLQTVMEKLLEDISFTANDRAGEKIIITADYVREQVEELVKSTDLSKFIL
ncbi:MAG: ATP-dependent protease ATPase subunit HslU [Alphaproteobacteria bacterium]|nr:ATP-dependent protease ATPase subunit HslU [Alphaproteobacteria bacterium]